MNIQLSVVQEYEALCQATGADSCCVVFQNIIISAWYSPNYSYPVYAMSSTKSITSLLVGMLLEERKIPSLDTSVYHFLPSWSEGRNRRVTIRHLLSHTSGLRRRYTESDSIGYVGDKNGFVIALTPEYEPGTRFEYSNEGVQLLSPILDLAAGEPIQNYAERHLFQPLEMYHTRLHLDEYGHAWTYADMETTTEDLTKIGILMLGNGKYNNTPIVSSHWIAESTRASQEFEPTCGLLWWLYQKPQGFAALGYLDTNIHVFPAQQLVVVRTQRKPLEGCTQEYTQHALRLFEQMVV